MAYQPIPLSQAELARIEADAFAGAFEDHRERMNPEIRADLSEERRLYALARFTELKARRLENEATAEGVVR